MGDLATLNNKLRHADQQRFVEKLAHRPGVRAFLAHHAFLIHRNVVGFPVDMDGRITAMMESVRMPDGSFGLSVVETPEEKALNRWRQGDFGRMDYLWAREWQRVRKVVMRNFYLRVLEKHGMQIEQPKNFGALRTVVDEIMNTPAMQPGLLRIIFSDFAVPMRTQVLAIKRFQSKTPRLLLKDFAPYAAFCLKANLLLGIGGALLKEPHPHDLRDLEYCYYLPFCHVFASDDRLHRKIAPTLLRNDQMFVGSELIADLRKLSQIWKALSPAEKIEFSQKHRNTPPAQDDSVIREIWERFSGPNAVKSERQKQPIDPFFRNLIKKQQGSDASLDEVDIEEAGFLVQRTQMTKERLQELYPGYNFDNE